MKSKRVLITGAYGFLGRHIAKKLKESGFHVTGIGHGKWYAEEFNMWGLDNWVESTITFEALVNINQKFDLIVHCGGGASVAFSYVNPYEDFQKSVQSTLAVLEFIRLQSPECIFTYPSSPAVQGDLGNIQIEEEMQSVPLSPYGAHKKIAEDLCLSYHKNYGIHIGIIRFFSIYGEGLQKQLLWDACIKIENDSDVTFFGTGSETRDWIHVSDAVSLIENFSSQLTGFHVINGGYGKPTRIKDVLNLISTSFNKKVKVNFNGHVKIGDPLHFWAENSKALLLGWKPNVDIETGIKRYVEYFKALRK